jgi:alpha-amylase/alpha-mannosidase (GH57 family)
MAASKRFICIHGHFYQPPRENPWLEAVETQDSAAPYHDWNERICAECYASNGAARIQNRENKITQIMNNYARMSFNFGPTLLSWLKENAPRTYAMILDGERRSRKSFKGHSSAMAQVYNHLIMPLANRRDRVTQIRWGIADYKQHYGKPPEGMWLAETAADTETLELLAREGIKFTVLAPHQCRRVRPLKEGAVWSPTPGATVETRRPYQIRFESGAAMAVFFYDGPTSRAIAFEGLLNSGDAFAARLKEEFKDGTQVQMVHVATDGESYGHHHRYGEMALAYALRLMEQDRTVRLTNYGSFLAQFPPEEECEIEDNTSWSCAHGVERWRSDCGCSSGVPGWNQEWRTPLREGLDALRDALIPLTEEEGAKHFRDVWEARDGYIDVILSRKSEGAQEAEERFFEAQQRHTLDEEERVRARMLMELQRNALLMYTSCGWFFDDISGIETEQVIVYAGRVLQLAKALWGGPVEEIEARFVEQLAEAKSNKPEMGDGARIYEEKMRTLEVELEKVAAHYAISSMFTSFGEETELYCYRVKRISHEIHTSGRGRLALGRAEIASQITGERQSFSYAALHFGDQNITAAVKAYDAGEAEGFEGFVAETAAQVQQANFPEVIRLLDRYYSRADYSLTSLFTDEQRRIMQLILNSTVGDIESSLTKIYRDHASLLRFLAHAGLPKPPALTLAAAFALNAGLRQALESETIDQATVRAHLKQAQADGVALETAALGFLAGARMKRAMDEVKETDASLESLEKALAMARTLTELPFELNLWQAQNLWYSIVRTLRETEEELPDEDRARWEACFEELGACLGMDYVTMKAAGPALETAGD